MVLHLHKLESSTPAGPVYCHPNGRGPWSNTGRDETASVAHTRQSTHNPDCRSLAGMRRLHTDFERGSYKSGQARQLSNVIQNFR